MKVVCDNCRAVYRIPDEKLVKEVNKATCRNCGHKMLIPRPRPGGDPDEPTNVRAVPPTPMGAPARARGGDDSDATMPRGVGTRDVPLTPGTPLGSPQRATTPRPAPQAVAPAAPAAPAFDPGGDMVLAMLGALASMFGALIMAIDDYPAIIGVGLFISLAGSFTTLMVLATGNRGRRPASKAISIVLSPIIAALAAVIVVGLHFGMSNFAGASPSPTDAGAAAAAAAVAQKPAEAPVPPTVATAEAPAEPEQDDPPEDNPPEDEAPEADTEADGSASAEPAAAPAASSSSSSSRSSSPSTSSSSTSSRPSSSSSSRTSGSSSSSSSRSTSSSSRSSGSTSSSRSRDEDLFGDTDAGGSSSSSSSLPDSVPVETIDVILRNNKDVKLCFAAYYKENGALPPRVDTRFTVASSGAVTDAEVTNAEYVATSLDSCMSRAIKKLAFPQTSGGSKKYNYPFILQ